MFVTYIVKSEAAEGKMVEEAPESSSSSSNDIEMQAVIDKDEKQDNGGQDDDKQKEYVPTRTPKQTLEAVYRAGECKAAYSWDVLMVQSFMAGLYKSVACQLLLTLGGGFVGAAVFPTGLIAITLTGAELFTGDSLIFVSSVLGRRVSIWALLRNWSISWLFNLFGCLAWAAILSYASDSLEDAGQADFAVEFAMQKAYQPWINIFLKGIGANFLVCLAVWQAATAEDVASKILAIWFPVQAFVNMQFEHSVANMYFIPVGMMLGADISVSRFLFLDLLPATLGNIVGGGLCIGFTYWYIFDSMATSIHATNLISHDVRRFSHDIKRLHTFTKSEHED